MEPTSSTLPSQDVEYEWDSEEFVIPNFGIEEPILPEPEPELPTPIEVKELKTPSFSQEEIIKKGEEEEKEKIKMMMKKEEEENIYLGPYGVPPSHAKNRYIFSPTTTNYWHDPDHHHHHHRRAWLNKNNNKNKKKRASSHW